jgi:bifunctional DNA-binding transcriptional regulator/antitoxin component of YhaV-PrlF toxin-antitoxin module
VLPACASPHSKEEQRNQSGQAVDGFEMHGSKSYLRKSGKADNMQAMNKITAVRNSGHVGRRGTIVLSSATRRRYGLSDGSLFISEEREDGVLIRPAQAVPLGLNEVRLKIRRGLEELDRGEGIPGKQVEAELKAMSKAYRARKRK